MSMRISQKSSNGFTLLEMIIVIFIIGILSIAALMSYSGIQARARDISVQSDIDRMEALQTKFSLSNNVVGKAYYSGDGPDIDLGFTPTEGNVVSVVISSTDYCIRAYNTGGSKNSLENAYIKESTPGVCDGLVTVENPIIPTYDSYPVATSISGIWSTAPDGYLLEDGSAVSRTIFSDLFAVIGTTHGTGDGSTTFNLPNSRGRVSVNQNSSDTQFVTVGQKYGEKVHTDIASESGLKGHNHAQNPHSHNKTVNFASSFPGGTDRPLYYGISSGSTATVWWDNTTATNQAVASSSASSAHNEIQPSMVKTYAIKYRLPSSNDSKLTPSTSIEGYFTSAPNGYLLENGSAVSRTDYSDLFAAIGTTYGSGDGSTTFNLPNSLGRVAVNKSSLDSEFDILGEVSGEKTHILTASEGGERGHNHTQDVHSHSKVHNFASSFPGGTDRPLYYGISSGSTSTISVDSVTATNQAAADSDAVSAHNNIQYSMTKKFAIKYTASVGSVDALPKGTSVRGYWTTPPPGYLLENGAAVSRVAYAGLFGVIGTTYGSGDGSTTFNLPDSRGRAIVNLSPTDSEFDTISEKYGEKTHLLTGAESGEKGHNHTQNAHNHPKLYNFANSFPGGTDRPLYYGIGTASVATVWLDNTTATNQAVSASNASSAHNNIQPSIVQNFAIRY